MNAKRILRIETEDLTVCVFRMNRVRYSVRVYVAGVFDWRRLINVIGRDKAVRAALKAAGLS